MISYAPLDMNNNRYQCLKFSVGCNSVLHGFAGYFETTLYKDVTLSKEQNFVCVCVCVCSF